MTYQITRVYELRSPFPVYMQSSCVASGGLARLHPAGKSMLFYMSKEEFPSLAEAIVLTESGETTVGNILSNQQFQTVCVRQPLPVCQLVLGRWWTELVVLPACYEGQRLGRTLPGQKTLFKKDIIIQGYPDQSWVERTAAKDADAPSQVSTVSRNVQPLTELAIEELKALLRKLASQSELAPQDLHTASESMKLLDSLALPFREALRRRHLDKNVRYTAEELLHAFLSAQWLRSTTHLVDVCQHLCKLVAPGLEDQVSAHVPSATTLRRSKAKIDWALLLLDQGKNKSIHGAACQRYGWSDSSPIGGRDWLISKHVAIYAIHLLPCYVAARVLALDTEAKMHLLGQASAERSEEGMVTMLQKLETSTGLMFDGCEDVETNRQQFEHAACLQRWNPLPQDARKALAKYLAEHIHSHCHVPASLAMGHTDVMHKASSLTHQIALECQSEADLAAWMHGIRSWTSDFGVEAGFTEMRVSACDLLPEWWSWGLQDDGERADTQATLLLVF
eukprot:163430-Amphidinium_carterae.2